MKARTTISFVILFLVLLALPVAGRYTHYYAGRPPARPEVARPALVEIEVPTPPAEQYSDEVIQPGDGLVLVDMAHDNQLQMPELSVLAGRLAARGHRLASWTGGSLEEALLEAGAFLVAVPLEFYDEDEVSAVEEFVDSGGRLLLIGDPTRYHLLEDDWGWISGIDSDAPYLNSLSASFGITFVDDYLYNVQSNEGSFRNIRLSDWGESELTAGLEAIVFYAAHSLAVAEEMAIIRADGDTWSSATDRAGGLIVAAQAAQGRALALGDLTFMTEPYHTVRDNSQLIAQIADFLTGAERTFSLSQFPLSFGPKAALIFTNNPDLGPGQLQLVDDLQEAFDESGRSLVLAEERDSRADAIFAGLYSQADPVTDTLAALGVTLTYTVTQPPEDHKDDRDDNELTPPEDDAGSSDEETMEDAAEKEQTVSIEGLGSYSMSGTALITYQPEGEQQELIVLAASQEGLANVFGRLLEGDLLDCVLADAITLCPTGLPSEEVAADWEPTEAEPDENGDGEGEDGAPAGVEGELAYGDTVSGELEADEEHLWTFEGAAGDLITIRVETTSSDMDLVLTLEEADGATLASADSSGGGGAEEIAGHELAETGAYAIRIAEYWGEGGDYALSLGLAGEEGNGDEDAAGGTITMGETVQETLDEGQTAAWVFSGEADQAVLIILQPDETGDAVLELQDPDGQLLESSDSGFAGEEERIDGLLPADGEYRIVVADYFGEPISYSLTLEEGGEGGLLGGWGVLIVSSDLGTPVTQGRTSADIFYDILSPDYDVTLWSLADDGDIGAEDMQGYQLVIWTSGDFREGDGSGLFAYMVDGGPLLLSGAYSVFEEGDETAALRDLEVSSSSSLLTTGFEAGEIIELSGEMEVIVFDYDQEEDEDTIAVFLRGPGSEQAGEPIVTAFDEGTPDAIQAMLIGFPLYMLPDSAQVQLVANAMEWFQVTPLP